MMRTKLFKSILALLLLAVMASSLLGVTAMAAAPEKETQAIELQPSNTTVDGETKTWEGASITARLIGAKDAIEAGNAVAYRLVDVHTIQANDGKYQPVDPEYTWASESLRDWVLENYASEKYAEEDSDNVLEVFEKLSRDVEFFGKLEAAIEDGTVSGLTSVEGEAGYLVDKNTAEFSDLSMGLWLLTIKDLQSVYQPTAVAVIPFTQEGKGEWFTNEKTVVSMKGTPVSLEKHIVIAGEEGASLNMDTAASYGERVKYQIDVLIPTFLDEMVTWDYTITDTMEHLKLDPDSVVIRNEAGEDITDAVKADDLITTESDSFTIDFSGKDGFAVGEAPYEKYLKGHTKLTVTYTAVLMQDAVLVEGNPNTATLNYSNNPYVEGDPTTLDDDALVYTYGLYLEKIMRIKKEDSPLPGVVFVMTSSETGEEQELHFRLDADGYYHLDPDGEDELVTDDEGNLKIVGLGEGTYTLKETFVPDKRLNKKPKPVTFTIVGETVDGRRTGSVACPQDPEPDELPAPVEPTPRPDGTIPVNEKRAYEKALAEYEQRVKEREEWERRHAFEAEGFYYLNVVNTPPGGARTGGLGSVPFTMMGCLMMAAGMTLVYFALRRRRADI